ncbi:hypothetical protein Taro_035117 [Colocasia esculenta]|uniref:Uncharacterized protein n=1 Tax=Colocasia esculenta TaxID=4460 RepID=A0A843W2T5_COLES|nr:hypothetical protein [Colocasia esculenta]
MADGAAVEAKKMEGTGDVAAASATADRHTHAVDRDQQCAKFQKSGDSVEALSGQTVCRQALLSRTCTLLPVGICRQGLDGCRQVREEPSFLLYHRLCSTLDIPSLILWNFCQVRGLPTLYFISTNPSKDAIRTEGLIPPEMIKNIIDNEM